MKLVHVNLHYLKVLKELDDSTPNMNDRKVSKTIVILVNEGMKRVKITGISRYRFIILMLMINICVGA